MTLRHLRNPLFLFSIFSFLFITLAADTPKEAVGFFGNATGIVKSVKEDGTSFTLSILSAFPDENSAIKDVKPMVGKTISLGTRMPKTNGVAHNREEDVAYIKTLKVGDQVEVNVFAVRADPTVLRITQPGHPTTQPATQPVPRPTTAPATAPAK